jgi:hypothetical protein
VGAPGSTSGTRAAANGRAHHLVVPGVGQVVVPGVGQVVVPGVGHMHVDDRFRKQRCW